MRKCRLKAILADKEIKHGDFAKMIGVNTSTLSTWISGKSRPSLEMAFQIADILHVDINEVWVKE